MHPDLYAARALVQAGAAAVMPLGSLIGSNQGLKIRTLIEVIIEEVREVPIIVDAGIGRPSHAAEAMEIGADGVLVNTAVAVAEDPVLMADRLRAGCRSGKNGVAGERGEGGRASKRLVSPDRISLR